jgi:hypothetical protein
MPALNLVRADVRQINEANAPSANDATSPVKPALAANDHEDFPGKTALMQFGRKTAATEQLASAASSRAAGVVSKLIEAGAGKTLALERDVERESPVAPAQSRAAAMAAGMNEKAAEYASVPPNESQYLRAFEETTRELVAAQRQFADQWAPVEQFVAERGNGNYTPEELRAVITETGDPAAYDEQVEHIAQLGAQSGRHLSALSEHLSTYRKSHGDDDAVEETAERVRDAGQEMSGAGSVPQFDAAGKVKDALKAIRELVERFVEALRNLFRRDATPA